MGEEKDSEIIHVRCSEGLKTRVGLASEAEGLSLSEYVRRELSDSAEETLSSAGISISE